MPSSFLSFPPLVLASQSAIRQKILHNAGLSFMTSSPLIDEREEIDIRGGEGAFSPNEMALFLAGLKAKSVSEDPSFNNAYVIGCDQICAINQHILHKVNDKISAFERIKILQNETHQLYSAICLAHEGNIIWEYVSICHLKMRYLTDIEITAYLEKAGESIFSSVGCYQLEGIGVQLFKKIEGDYFSILGLPLLPLLQSLQSLHSQ